MFVVDLYVIRIQCVVRNLNECANVCIYCVRACETTRYLFFLLCCYTFVSNSLTQICNSVVIGTFNVEGLANK